MRREQTQTACLVGGFSCCGALWLVFLPPGDHILNCFLLAGADKKAEAGAGSATEFQFVSISLFAPIVTGAWAILVGSGVWSLIPSPPGSGTVQTLAIGFACLMQYLWRAGITDSFDPGYVYFVTFEIELNIGESVGPRIEFLWNQLTFL